MYTPNELIETRMYVFIRFHANNIQSLATKVYFRNDMTFHFFHRWKWYFKYRAALLQVQNPRGFVSYEYGTYQYELPVDAFTTKLRNQLIAAKRELSIYERKIKFARDNWNEIFPIEDNPHWVKIQSKHKYYTDRILQLEKTLSEI